MAMICASIPRDMVSQADAFTASIGSNLQLAPIIEQIDFDPHQAIASVEALVDAHNAIVEGRPDDCLALLAASNVEWAGPARDQACDDVECQRTFWEHVGDFLLWLAEQLLQIIDWIVDVVRVVVAWITWLATAISAALVILVAISGLISGGILAAFEVLFAAPGFAFFGAVAAVGVAASFLLWLLNQGVEWLQTVIRDARAKICGKGLPSLPDFDPEGPWFPPAFPA